MSATVAPTAAAARPEVPFAGVWWIALVAGALTMLVGALALLYPGPTLLAIGLLLGIYLVLWGVLTAVRGIGGAGGLPVVLRVLLVILGLISVLAGLLLVVRPGESVLTAAWVLGFWWVLAGVAQVVSGIAFSEGRVANLLLGALGVVAGAIILAQPGIGLVTLVWIAGIGLLVQGAVEVAAGWQLRKLGKELGA